MGKTRARFRPPPPLLFSPPLLPTRQLKVEGLKHGHSVCTWNFSPGESIWTPPLPPALRTPPSSLHVTVPSQGPRIDKLHPATISRTRIAIFSPPEKIFRRWCVILPVSPTGTVTMGCFPWMSCKGKR